MYGLMVPRVRLPPVRKSMQEEREIDRKRGL
jgi:hypothetical protein